MALAKSIARAFSHLVFQPGMAKRKFLGKYCSNIKGKTILEIGSGKPANGKYPYSVRQYFEKNNKFECTDINPKFGHKVLDITKPKQGIS